MKIWMLKKKKRKRKETLFYGERTFQVRLVGQDIFCFF